ncbi:hypothetical protein EXU85_20310 [Spirosoma sp. KCTC 42546]|uniref:hypothetical protein n=1 Tax=Spirosoma sp. KCTC 42546 TaxID=2520506 RepID=UPI00115ABA76|nr:hypothetical protein [Spirosoma sp. KCTC 42546]QDK80823.1 hypothetical protein EXU85_20310 [Spirosoma sp. KCTC 42546]
MSRTRTPQSGNRKPSTPTWLDKFEHLSRILYRYWRWHLQFAAIILCGIFLKPEVATILIPAITLLGGASTIKELRRGYRTKPDE